jgi:hypothetical protein
MPYLSREGTCDEQMVHSLRRLIAEDTSGWVRQMAPLQSVCGPTSVFQSLPKEETYSWWSPSLPDQLPGIELDRTMEGGKIARLG